MDDLGAFEQLIARVKKGDQQAALELVSRYEPIVKRAIRFRLEDERLSRTFDSVDVCQSVLGSFFIRAAIGEYELNSPEQLVRLLVTMAKNKVASAARRAYRKKRDMRRVMDANSSIDPIGKLNAGDASPSVQVAGKELVALAVQQMNVEERRMAEMRGEGASWQSIAERLGGTPQSRRVQFARTMKRIVEHLGLDGKGSLG